MINDSHTYVLGHSTEEQRRLDQQGLVLRPYTERLLRASGISPGMRAIDVGCGTGDVTLLLAELVGPEGHVIGVDRGPAALETAASRVTARGWRHVSFVQDDITAMTFDQPFDAVVGRLVLMYQSDPAEVLRHLATLIVPGGILAFLEIVLVPGLPSPDRPLFSHAYRLVTTAFAASGAHVDMGLRLPAEFLNAGLPNPSLQVNLVTPVGADRAWLGTLAGVTRSLLPAIERFSLATAEEVAVGTLLDRLLEEAQAANNAVAGPTYVGAWCQVPRES